MATVTSIGQGDLDRKQGPAGKCRAQFVNLLFQSGHDAQVIPRERFVFDAAELTDDKSKPDSRPARPPDAVSHN